MTVKLQAQVSKGIRLEHDFPCTEESYVHWIMHFILFHGKRQPKDMDAAEVEA